jgi:hypothetical protein
MTIKVRVASLHDCEKEIKKMFHNILADYCERFGVTVTNTKVKEIIFCLVHYDDAAMSAGLTCYADDGAKILIQLRDPFLSDWEGNPYTMTKFVGILAHEIVHACQHLTGRKGIKINNLKYDKTKTEEAYFFSPDEIEARIFEDPYASLYGQDLL